MCFHWPRFGFLLCVLSALCVLELSRPALMMVDDAARQYYYRLNLLCKREGDGAWCNFFTDVMLMSASVKRKCFKLICAVRFSVNRGFYGGSILSENEAFYVDDYNFYVVYAFIKSVMDLVIVFL